MSYRENEHDCGDAARDLDFPTALGWRRIAELDDESREAWELRDGTVLLLDPTGQSDSRIRRAEADPPLFCPAGAPA
jgi:hypothetical protein